MLRVLFLSIIFINILSSQTLTSTYLPIIKINTGGANIPNEPKIAATMQIIYNGPGVLNNVTDPPNHFNGAIGIESRGSSSAFFPKASFGFETRDLLGADVKLSLLGMPAESDWILSANYTDKSFTNNVLAYTLARKQGRYGSRARYVEVLLNNNYIGVYVMMEKIKRDIARVDIAKLRPVDTAGVDLTGGYILKIDKNTGSSTNTGWYSNYKVSNCSSGCYTYAKFQHEYPDEAVMHVKQKNYIRQYVDSFETALFSPSFDNPLTGYRKFASTASFIDYMLINELSKNVDGYRISTYFFKDKNEKLRMGPVWDYDIGFGNANYCQGGDTAGWAFNFNYACGPQALSVPAWWERFNQDTNFKNQTKCLYTQYRQSIFSKAALFNTVDSMAAILKTSNGTNSPITRDSTKWKIIGSYVWPNPTPVPTSYNGEIQEIKTWLSKRINWLDANITGNCIQPTVALSVSNNITKCEGENVTLQINGTGPYPEYNWYKNGIKITGATSASYTLSNLSLADAGQYTCLVRNLYNQEIISTAIVLSVNAYPSVGISSVNSACAGTSINIAANGIASTYNWSTGNTGSNFSINLSKDTTITLTALNGACSTTVSKSIQALPLPILSITSVGGDSICNGKSKVLNVFGASTYLWNNGSTNNSINVSPSSNTTYSVVGTAANTCSSSVSKSIVVLSVPVVSISSANNLPCAGTAVTLTASGAAQYLWSGGQSTSSITVTPNTATTYTVIGAQSICSDTAQIVQLVKSLPNVSISSLDTILCEGEYTTLTVSGAASYIWNNGSTDSALFMYPLATSTYSVTGILNGCSKTVNQTVIVNPYPSVTFNLVDSVVCPGASAVLSGGVPLGGLYTGVGVNNGSFNSNTLPAGFYAILYQYTDQNACSASKLDYMKVDLCAGIENINSANNFSLFPNPANDRIHIDSKQTEMSQIEIYNALGQKIWLQKLQAFNATIDVSQWSNGQYFVNIVYADGKRSASIFQRQ